MSNTPEEILLFLHNFYKEVQEKEGHILEEDQQLKLLTTKLRQDIEKIGLSKHAQLQRLPLQEGIEFVKRVGPSLSQKAEVAKNANLESEVKFDLEAYIQSNIENLRILLKLLSELHELVKLPENIRKKEDDSSNLGELALYYTAVWNDLCGELEENGFLKELVDLIIRNLALSNENTISGKSLQAASTNALSVFKEELPQLIILDRSGGVELLNYDTKESCVLDPLELKLLDIFIRFKGEEVTYEDLCMLLLNVEPILRDGKIIITQKMEIQKIVNNLRKKLKNFLHRSTAKFVLDIQTINNVGYTFIFEERVNTFQNWEMEMIVQPDQNPDFKTAMEKALEQLKSKYPTRLNELLIFNLFIIGCLPNGSSTNQIIRSLKNERIQKRNFDVSFSSVPLNMRTLQNLLSTIETSIVLVPTKLGRRNELSWGFFIQPEK